MKSPSATPEKEIISAGEVNKYAYCPYQWYYGRIHGDKALRAIYRELHPGADPAAERNFTKGRAFHEGFGRHERLKRGIILTFIIAALVLAFIALRRYVL